MKFSETVVINTVGVENNFENSGLNSQKGEIGKEKLKEMKYSYTIVSNKLMKYDSKGIMMDIDKIIIIIIRVEMQSFNSLEINVQIKLSEVS